MSHGALQLTQDQRLCRDSHSHLMVFLPHCRVIGGPLCSSFLIGKVALLHGASPLSLSPFFSGAV